MKIDCLKVANNIYDKVKKDLINLKDLNLKFKIVIIKLQKNSATDKYINFKIKKATELGINVEVVSHLKTEEELILYLDKLNRSKNVNGYIVQFPLPKSFNLGNVLNHISHLKDLDGLSNKWLSSLLTTDCKTNCIQPATAKAIMSVIDNQKYNLCGKHAVILNRSLIVGKPIAQMLINKGATVTVCNSKTKNLNVLTNMADLLIVAVGIPNFIKKRSVKKNAFVIDVGINFLNDKMVGDVDYKQVESQARYITPVPNGIGRVTTAMIFDNLVELIKLQQKK